MTQVYASEKMKIFARTMSFPHDMEDPEMVEQMFADLVYADVDSSAEISPKSPISEENYPVSPKSIVENDVDAIFDEVLSMHDSLSTPPSPKSTFSDDQTTNHGPESYFVPDLQATLNSYQEIQEPDNQPIITSSNEEQQPTQGTVRTVMSDNGEYFNVVVIPSDQVPENYQMGNVIFSPKRETSETKMDFMPSPLSAALPLTPPASVASPVSPEQASSPVTDERLSRKRCQNKQSSKKYRQKIKDREQALFDAVGNLNKKKRELELELASTKAVNKFLVDSLKQKFGIF